jgi:hypothetical protein
MKKEKKTDQRILPALFIPLVKHAFTRVEQDEQE